jgi:predicted alpha/beta hydrolase
MSVVEITAGDGTTLVADLFEPRRARGTVVLAHAMMASRRTLARGLMPVLGARGFRVVNLDFRGHGASGTPASRGGDWSYDDLVRHDLPALVGAVRERFDGPVALVGHSLGGHVAAASRGLGRIDLDALVMLAGNVWLPRFERSRRMRLVKGTILEATARTVLRVGYLPVRRLRLGSDDEAKAYFVAFRRFWRDDAWTSDDGRDDYLSAVGRVTIPTLAISSEGDRLACAPPCAEAFARALGSRDLVVHVERGPRAPGHMELATRRESAPVWARIADFLEDRLSSG